MKDKSELIKEQFTEKFNQLSTGQLLQFITGAITEYVNRREDVLHMYKRHLGEIPESMPEAVYLEGFVMGLLIESRNIQAVMHGQDVNSTREKRQAFIEQIEEELRAVGLAAKG